jgi:Zn-dependent protease with chaperone function
MMFSMLAACVCLAALFLVLFATSVMGLPLLRIAVRRWSVDSASAANLLFAGRVFPMLLSITVTFGLALPAFLRFEPRSTGEVMGVKLLLLAAAGGLTLVAMFMRGIRILGATASTVALWRARSEERLVNVGNSPVCVNFVSGGAPALLAVTGFFRCKIFVAEEAAGTLSAEELSAALAHELAHVSFLDNLKRLLLKITRPPRWTGGAALDHAWMSASEVAADEAALAQGVSPLDLASALVKMVALKKRGTALDDDELAASHLVPDAVGSSLAMRIDCLQRAMTNDLAETNRKSAPKAWRSLAVTALFFALYVTAASTLLPAIHEALEFLVR